MASSLLCTLDAAPRKNNNHDKNKNRIHIKKGNPSELPVVKSVTRNGLVVGDKRYVVDSSTDITVNGEEASLSDIKVGMQALVSGGVEDFGATQKDTLFKADRIVARVDNELSKKANRANKPSGKKH